MSAEKEIKQFNITVDDGRIEVPVYNKQGEKVGVFYFNPTDIGIVERYNKFIKDFESITEPLEKESDDMTEAFEKAKTRLFDACNEMFCGDVAGAFFGQIHPFSPLQDGTFYCENVITALGKFIEQQFETSIKKIERKLSKYTKGYKKGV